MVEKLFDIKGLHVVYKTDLETVYAVNGVNLSLGRGETLGLVGETGAGKTTLALAMLRLLPERTGYITAGELIYEGRNMMELDEPEIRKIRGAQIAMIFQDPMTALNPVLTVGQQIGEAIELHSENTTKEKINARVEEVLRLVGIEPERKKDYPHQFSGGMKQRVVIAMALACEPKLIIADEPTTALDVTIQAQVLMMMRELRNRLNTAMIMITHDLGIVAQICDRVAIMYAGSIIEGGRAEDIFEADLHHPYTTGLFGAIPDLEEEVLRLTPIHGLMPDPTDLPPGCCFASRCEHCMEKCQTHAPSEYVNGTHRIACHLFNGEEEKA